MTMNEDCFPFQFVLLFGQPVSSLERDTLLVLLARSLLSDLVRGIHKVLRHSKHDTSHIVPLFQICALSYSIWMLFFPWKKNN